MKKPKLSLREGIMIGFLVVLLVGVIYYMGFYTPLQEDLATIASDTANVEAQIAESSEDVRKMDAMQAELDEILARPEDEITEIAPYDNKEVVLNQLYLILGHSDEYVLSFTDPEVEEGGTVRRNIDMEFQCSNYESAKTIIENLTDSHWRCLVSNLAIVADYENLETGSVSVTATITFFEHTGLK